MYNIYLYLFLINIMVYAHAILLIDGWIYVYLVLYYLCYVFFENIRLNMYLIFELRMRKWSLWCFESNLKINKYIYFNLVILIFFY